MIQSKYTGPENGTTRNKNYRTISLKNTNGKNSKKY
jgi:hypothetical protein